MMNDKIRLKFPKMFDQMLRSICLLSALLLVALWGAADSAGAAKKGGIPTHLDNSINEFGCGACHKGHGRPGTAMLRKTVPDLCFNCHSPTGDGPLTASSDVYSSQFRRYKHPVIDTARQHRADEKFPEGAAQPRHVSCLDCHNSHASLKDNPLEGAIGFDKKGLRKKVAETESEVCYRCHADSLNKPFANKNTREEFDPSNASYHPVERSARGLSLSLKPGMSGKTISCSDCHHPHGSEYPSMLRYNYTLTDGPEMPYSYEICYSCHRRDNILSDQGFKWHRKHIVIAGTSCATCHRAHGSANNKRLIEFNRTVVRPNKSGALNYSKVGEFSSCSLNCHGVEHNNDKIELLPEKVKKIK